jgi:menaquinone-dependent protoporphyrinogen oxidase
MNPRVLVACASRHGSTHETADVVAATLREHGLEVDVRAAGDVEDVAGYDAVVLGGALSMGRWHRDARRLLRHHAAALARVPVAVFAMAAIGDEAEMAAAARRQLDRALSAVPQVVPVSAAVFAGVFDPAEHPFPFSRTPALDARDPEAVRSWARAIAPVLAVADLPADSRR